MKNKKVKSNIFVAVRIRPFLPSENMSESPFRIKQTAIQIQTDGMQRTFQFDQVIPISTTQQQVYVMAAQPTVQNWINGINGSIIVYGQTSSGKTYTCGLGEELSDGVVYRTLMELFSSPKIKSAQIELQFIQIYNDKIQNLLNPEQSNIQLKEVSKNNWQLYNTIAYRIKSVNEAIKLIKYGMKNRAISSTFMNQSSSRAHTVLQLTLKQQGLSSSLKTRVSTLYIIDLAGSERVNKSKSTGQTFTEAVAINSSLSYLGKVITAIGKNESFIPYRHCTLTKLLSSALTINSRTCVICTLCPSVEQQYESLSTLEFAKSCREIVQTVKFEEDSAKLGQSGGYIKLSERDMLMQLCQEAGIGQKDMYSREEVEKLINYQNNQIDMQQEFQRSEEEVKLQLREDIQVKYCQQMLKKDEDIEQACYQLLYGKQTEKTQKEKHSTYKTQKEEQLEKLLNSIRKISEKNQYDQQINCNEMSMKRCLQLLNLQHTTVDLIQKELIQDIKQGSQIDDVIDNIFIANNDQIGQAIEKLKQQHFYTNYLKRNQKLEQKKLIQQQDSQNNKQQEDLLPEMVFETKYKRPNSSRKQQNNKIQNKMRQVDLQYVLDKLATDLPILIQNIQKQNVYEVIFYYLLIIQSCNIWNQSQIFDQLEKRTSILSQSNHSDQMQLDWAQK